VAKQEQNSHNLKNGYFMIRDNIKLFTKTNIPFVPLPTRRDTLVLQVGGWAWGSQPHPIKPLIVGKILMTAGGQKHLTRSSKTEDLEMRTWNALSPYRSGALPERTGVGGRPNIRLLDSDEKI
jgi:hypothetical protein